MQHHFLCNISYVVIAESMRKSLSIQQTYHSTTVCSSYGLRQLVIIPCTKIPGMISDLSPSYGAIWLDRIYNHGTRSIGMANKNALFVMLVGHAKWFKAYWSQFFCWFWQIHWTCTQDVVIFVLTTTTYKLITLPLAHVCRVNIFTTNISRFMVVLFIIVLSLVHVKCYCLILIQLLRDIRGVKGGIPEASNLSTKSQESQVSTLIYAMGDKLQTIFSNCLAYQRMPRLTKERFRSHFVKRWNTTFKQAKFDQWKLICTI